MNERSEISAELIPTSVGDVLADNSSGVRVDRSPAQMAAIRLSYSIGARLAEEHPEVADIFMSSELTHAEIAALLIPEEVEVNPGIASHAVGKAISFLMPKEEIQERLSELNAIRMKRTMEALGPDGFKEHQRKAAIARNTGDNPPDAVAMIESHGYLPWTDQERVRLFELKNDPRFQYPKGYREGKPNARLIADQLNLEFHDGSPIRTRDRVNSHFNMAKRRGYKIT